LACPQCALGATNTGDTPAAATCNSAKHHGTDRYFRAVMICWFICAHCLLALRAAANSTAHQLCCCSDSLFLLSSCPPLSSKLAPCLQCARGVH
jgi:hypothetical protein